MHTMPRTTGQVLMLLGLLTTAMGEGIFIMSLQKEIYIGGGNYSVINITSDSQSIQTSVMFAQTNFTVTKMNPFSNIKFDMYQGAGNYSQMIDCYTGNTAAVYGYYQLGKACNINCTMDNINSTLSTSSASTTLSQNSGTNVTYIIDNTLFPCLDGTYYPEILLYQTLMTILAPNYTFFYVEKISLLVIVQILIVMCAWNIVLYMKLRKHKKILDKLNGKNMDKQLLETMTDRKKKRDSSPSQKGMRRANSSLMELHNRDTSFIMKTESQLNF